MSEISGTAQWTLAIVDMGLKSSVWLGLAVLLLWAMRGETARVRHRVCLVALCGLPFLLLPRCLPPLWKIPVGNLSVPPAIPVPAGQSSVPVRATAVPSTAVHSANLPSAAPLLPLTVRQQTADNADAAPIRLQGAAANGNSGFAPPASLSNDALSDIPTRRNPPVSGVTILASVWMAGFVLVMLRNLSSWRALNRLLWNSAPAPVGHFADALRNAACDYGGGKNGITLRMGGQKPGFAVPMTWGWLRPVVWLPHDAEGWTPERLRVVLLHEVAHIQRGDWLWQTVASCLCALYWFHPLAWLLHRRLHLESERACDDCVLQTGVPPASYAQHLLDVARALKSLRGAPRAAVTMARSSQIETRIRAILASRDTCGPPLSRTRARIAALALPVALLSLSATRLTAFETRPSARVLPFTITAREPQASHIGTAGQAAPLLPPGPIKPAQAALLAATSETTKAAVIAGESDKPVPAARMSASPLPVSLPNVFSADTSPVAVSPRPAPPLKNVILETTGENGSKGAKNAGAADAEKPRSDEDQAAKNAGAQDKPDTQRDTRQENKAKEENTGVQEPPADIEPEAARMMAQSAETYGALNSLSLTIHFESSPPIFGLSHHDWNVLWKNPNRAIITCSNSTGTTRFLADGSSLYVFARRDTLRYARLPLKPNGTGFWRQMGHAIYAGVSGIEHFSTLMEGRSLARILGSSLRTLKMGEHDTVEGVATQNVLAEMEYRFYPPFATGRQAPTSTQRALRVYAIGVEDHLVHRITEKSLTPPGKDGNRFIETTQTFANIKTNPDIPDSAFAFTPPADLEAVADIADLGERNHDHHLKAGVAAPDFTARDINGKTVSLSQYRGKTVLLVFWTRDCGSTHLDTDDLAAQYRKYRAQGFEVIGVCDDSATSRATLPAFLKKRGMTWPQIWDGGRANGPIFRRYGVKGTTQAMLIGRDGNILNPDASIGSYLNYQLAQMFSQPHGS